MVIRFDWQAGGTVRGDYPVAVGAPVEQPSTGCDNSDFHVRQPTSVPNRTAAELAAILKDQRTLAKFVWIYCKHQHVDACKTKAVVRGINVSEIAGRELMLCEDCSKLLAHALIKRAHCPLRPKPSCKNCPVHCYHTEYRKKIREVMRFSGRKILLSGRLDYLYHILF